MLWWHSWKWSSNLGLWERRSFQQCWRCCWLFWSKRSILFSERKESSKVKGVSSWKTRLYYTSIWTHKEEIEATPRDTTHTRTKQKPNHIFNPGHVSLKRFLKRKVEKKKSLPLILNWPNLHTILTITTVNSDLLYLVQIQKNVMIKIHDRSYVQLCVVSLQSLAGLAPDTANSSSTEQDLKQRITTVAVNMSDKRNQWEQPGLCRHTAWDWTNNTKAVCDNTSWRNCPPLANRAK